MTPRSRYAALLATLVVVVGSLSAVTASASLATTNVEHPSAVALDGNGDLWVASSGTHGVTEFAVATGKLLRVVRGKADGFNDPTAIAVDGDHVWIVSSGVMYRNGKSRVGTATELNATNGGLIRVVSLKSRGLSGTASISTNGADVWIATSGGGRVAKLSNTTGAVLRVFRTGKNLVAPGGIFSGYSHVWIPSPSVSGGIVERNATTGAFIRTIPDEVLAKTNGETYKMPTALGPQYVTVSARYVWVANESGKGADGFFGSISQINPSTGAIVRVIDKRKYGFSSTRAICSSGDAVWVVNGTVGTSTGTAGDSVTELNAESGALVRFIPLPASLGSEPWAIATNGRDVFVADEGAGNVVELRATTGAVVRILT